MKVRKALATVSAATLLSAGFTGSAMAAPRDAGVVQSGGAAGLVAAVVNANVQDVDIDVVQVGDVNVRLQNVLNNNRIIQDVLNNNDIDVVITDVVDVAVVDNVLVVSVLSRSNVAVLDTLDLD